MSHHRRLALALTLAVLGPPSFVQAEPVNRVDKVSNADFARTVQQLETALKSRGMMIVATIDHQNMMRMVGVSLKGSKTIEFGKPDMGKMTIARNPEAGLEMPGKIYVWERADGRAVVSYYRTAPAFAAYGKDNLKMAGEMMDKMLDEIVAEATK
ncbi:MAG TPA: DUF302 domain-containing protein [Candidatus Binatia bacterium]|jgi:uncharacterized protein (DUF302 family)|nr:DUF302 domain-containing protein [Candidatus Binatia bacterium]